ncbi:PAS domain S-box protein [Nostoc sp. UHCC 0302]|uniref:PAS domain S-box protein n=1 Tax=Nostoc sp. UHCC 0302 TaxID=3134896 RepID=UPI00311CA185
MRFNDQLINLPTLDHVLDRSPLTISPDSYVVEAIVLMSQKRSINYTFTNFNQSLDSRCCNQEASDYVLIVDGKHLLGIFTVKDVVRVTASSRDLSKVKIAEVMTQQVVSLKQSDCQNILTALLLLHQHQIRHLPILDDDGQLLGIVTETDLLQVFDLVKMIGVVEGLQQYLQKPTNELKQFHQQIDNVVYQTQNHLKRWVEEKSAQVMEVNEELQQTLEQLRLIEEELRQQNEELIVARESAELERQRYHDLFEFAPDGYLVTDAAGIIKEVNSAAATLLCVPQKYLVGKPLVLYIAKQDRTTFLNQLKNLQQVQDWEIYLQPREGKPFPASVRVAAIYDLKGERVGWHLLFCNISERKQVEEALRQATEQLEARVAERTGELVVSNVLLHQEITERQRAEEALRQSENLYRHLVESQTDVIIRVDFQGRLTFANAAACQTFGWKVDEFRGQSFFEVFDPNDLPQVIEKMATLASPPYGLTTGEQRAFTVNGIRWFQWNVTAIKNEQGEVVEAQGVGRDITERKQMEEALRESEEKFRHLAANTHAVIWNASPDSFRIFYVSPAYEKIWGRSCQSLYDQPESWIDSVHPDDHDRIRVTTEQQLSSDSTEVEYRIFRPDGSMRWIWDRSFAVYDEQGIVSYYGGIAEDITERKLAEVSLRESEEKFRHFAENTHALIWIADPNSGENLYVNPAYTKIWGRSCQSLRDQPNSWRESVYPEDRKLVEAKLEQQLHGLPSDTEYRIVQPDGSVRWVWDRGFAMQDAQGKVYSYGGVAEDITERKQAEESLRESETRLSLALAAAQMGIWDWNLLTDKAVWSPEMSLLYGLPSDTLCPTYAELLNLLVHPQDRESLAEVVAHSIEQGIEFTKEYRVVWPDGSLHWLCLKGQVYHNELSQPMRMIGTIKDISDRKQAEEALRESEERYRSVVTAMQEGIMLLEADDGRIIACNTSAESILGLNADEAIGRTIYDSSWSTVYEDGSPFPVENYPAIVTLSTGKPCSNVVMGVHKPNKQLAWISINCQPLFRDNVTTPYAVVASFSDITEQQAARQERQQTQEKIREQAALLDIATDGIIVRDFQTQILFWNKGAERLYGWQASEAVGKNPNELLFKKTTPQPEVALKSVMEFGTWQGELNKVTKSGKEIIVESRWTLVCDAQGEPKSILCVDTDITEKKQLQEQFFRTQRLESLGTLAGGIAHDLNNILTPILAAAQLVQGRFIQDKERSDQLLAIVESNAKRGAALVKQVLSFARGLKGEQTIVQLKHLIAEIAQIAKQTFPKSIEFSTVLPEDLWAVSGDITQLHQVLMNLVVNARDAMPDGGSILITAENKLIDEAYTRMNLDATVGNYIVLTVEDTGMGMPPEILDRIFEPFFTTKEAGTGTGLGLSTVLGIIKTHKGFIKVSSQVNKGSQFKLFLPAVETSQALSTEDLDMPEGQGELILVVDDEVQICEVARVIMDNHNYKTLTASNGIEAIALYAQHKHKIKAVLMDMMMPEMDGTTAIRTLQRMNPQVQIIACSGLNSAEFFAHIASPDVQAFLAKPFTAKELLKSLRQILTH